MPSISQYFNPCSKEFHTCRDFKTLTVGQRVSVVLLTALATLCSIGFLSFAVSRLLVTRFSKWNLRDLPQTSLKTHVLSQQVLVKDEVLRPSTPIPSNIPIVPIIVNPPKKAVPFKALELGAGQKQFFFNGIQNLNPLSHVFPVLPPEEQVKRIWIQSCLHALGKDLGDSVYNADCFMHAFCQALNSFKKTNYNVNYLREKLSLALLDFEMFPRTWMDDWFDANKGKVKETYKEFKKTVHLSGKNALWSFPQREGRILGAQYEVHIKIYKADILGLTKEKATALLNDSDALQDFLNPPPDRMGPNPCAFYEDPKESVIVPTVKDTITLVAYPISSNRNFYLPVFDKNQFRI